MVQPSTVRDLLELDHPVVVFDGECVLCSGFFRFLLRRDKACRFSFVIAQSPLGEQLYRELGLSTRDYETNLVFARGKLHTKADAFAAATRELGGLWRGLSVVRWAPRWLKTPIYDRIASNRYRIFGRNEHCMLPSEETKSRFLTGGHGWTPS